MNKDQLLALMANEVNQLDQLFVNDSLKKLAEGRLSPEERKKLDILAESQPHLIQAIEAYTPLDSDFFASVERNIENSMKKNTVDNTDKRPSYSEKPTRMTTPVLNDLSNQDIHSDGQSTDKKPEQKHVNHKKMTSKYFHWRDWFKSNSSWALSSACAATIAFVSISFFDTPDSPTPTLEANSLPHYVMEVSGHNTTFRGTDRGTDRSTDNHPSKTDNNSTSYSAENRVEVYPENQLTITLRPSQAIKNSNIEEKLYLVSHSRQQELSGNVSRAKSGAIRITVKQNKDSLWPLGESKLVAVIALEGSLPSESVFHSILESGVKSYNSEYWVMLSQTILVLNES